MKVKPAFTLIEMIMVMLLIAITAVVAFVSLSSYKTQYLYAAANGLASDLRYCKSHALNAAQWAGASFQVSPTNTYNVYETNGTTDTNLKSLTNPSQDFIVNIYNNYGGVAISGVNISGGNKVEFSPTGVPYNDKNGAALASDGVITLSYGGSTKTVRIAASTGRIYIQ